MEVRDSDLVILIKKGTRRRYIAIVTGKIYNTLVKKGEVTLKATKNEVRNVWEGKNTVYVQEGFNSLLENLLYELKKVGEDYHETYLYVKLNESDYKVVFLRLPFNVIYLDNSLRLTYNKLSC